MSSGEAEKRVRAKHFKTQWDYCNHEGQPWPCDTIAALDEARAEGETGKALLAELLDYASEVEAMYSPQAAVRSYLLSLPESAEDLGNRVRAFLATPTPGAPR